MAKNEKLDMAIARRLREIREAKGISQLNVYIATDCFVSRIEMGNQDIRTSTLYRLCEYYGVTMEEFFKDFHL